MRPESPSRRAAESLILAESLSRESPRRDSANPVRDPPARAQAPAKALAECKTAPATGAQHYLAARQRPRPGKPARTPQLTTRTVLSSRLPTPAAVHTFLYCCGAAASAASIPSRQTGSKHETSRLRCWCARRMLPLAPGCACQERSRNSGCGPFARRRDGMLHCRERCRVRAAVALGACPVVVLGKVEYNMYAAI